MRPGRLWAIALVAPLSMVLSPVSAKSPIQRRCGWLYNVTPGNFELSDRDGSWTIAQQGGYEAAGLDNLPNLPKKQWIKTNGPHGYACSCIIARTDRSAMLITEIISAGHKPLKLCRNDRKLPKP